MITMFVKPLIPETTPTYLPKGSNVSQIQQQVQVGWLLARLASVAHLLERGGVQVMEESIRKPWFTWMKTSNHIIRVREFRWKQPARGAGNSFHQSVGESCDFLPDSISSYVDSCLDTFRNGGWTDSFFIAKLQESLLLFQSCDLERETTLW